MGNMGLHMATNLVKNGAIVKGFDLSEKTLENAKALVSLDNLASSNYFVSLGYNSSYFN